MADPGQILDALRQADAAGDTAGAQRLAQLYKDATAPPPNTFIDMVKGGVSGLAKTAANTIDNLPKAGNVNSPTFTQAGQQLANTAAIVGNAFAGRDKYRPIHVPSAVDMVANVLPQPQTMPGRVTERVAPFALGALAPGSLPARIGNAVIPALASEGAGGVADAAGASPQVVQGARVVGGLVGGAAASARLTPRAAPASDEAVANAFATRAKVDPNVMASKAAEMRTSGVEPTLIDVTGTPGQRLVKAVGITNDQAGETLQNNAGTVGATTKPAVMANTRNIAGENRTAAKLVADLDTARSTEAQTKYSEPYAQPVDLTDLNVIQALRDPEGAAAINRAITGARARMDYGAVADLQQLKATAAGPTGDAQVWPTTGRALDRVQIAFGNKAGALAKNGSGDIASGLYKRQGVINDLLDTVPGLNEARAAYRAKSTAIDILNGPGKLDPFSTDPADYAAWVKGLPPEARHANQVAIRQDILDTLGGQRASTMGSLDELATSPYARENLSAALGDAKAAAYLTNIASRLAQKRNAAQVSPYAGSPTKMLQNDTSGLDHILAAADIGQKVLTGRWIGVAARLSGYLKTMGMSDANAQELARASIDPSRLDGVIAAIRTAKSPRAAQSFVNFRGGLLGVMRPDRQIASQPTPQPAPR